MIGDKKTPRLVLESAYFKAVTRILIRILHVDAEAAHEEVAAWQGRMAGTASMKSGVFLHDDPLRTAVEIHGGNEPELNEREQLVYRTILSDSLHDARVEAKSHDLWEMNTLRQPVQPAKLPARQESAPAKRLTATAGR